MRQDEGKPCNLQLKRRILPKPKVNHAGMGMFEPEFPLAEIPIISDQNSSFSAGNGEDFGIKEPCGVVCGNSGDIMTKFSEVGSEPGISTLIKQKFHASGGGVRFSS